MGSRGSGGGGRAAVVGCRLSVVGSWDSGRAHPRQPAAYGQRDSR